MNRTELCQAWIDVAGVHHYVDINGIHSFNLPSILESAARTDGLTITWPDGPGLATLVPIPDLWEQVRATLMDHEPQIVMPGSLLHAVRALLDAHDRGEL